MAAPIEDYALLSDLQTGPLVSRTGSVDWLCFPRFDSPSLFNSLLGKEDHGRWLLAPSGPEAVLVERRYVDSTFVLQTIWETPTGLIRATDASQTHGFLDFAPSHRTGRDRARCTRNSFSAPATERWCLGPGESKTAQGAGEWCSWLCPARMQSR
jgi:GH15 family glucan-1,4-alpha-glucosidase